MEDLSNIRESIDKVDKELVKLIEERMDLAAKVAEYKKTVNKPIYDRDREIQKIESLKAITNNPQYKESIEEIFLQLMAISRKYQYSLIGDSEHVIDSIFNSIDMLHLDKDEKVVYQGVEGAYSEEAGYLYFGENANYYNVESFEEVLKHVVEGKAAYGILPIENSSAGFVTGIYDLIDRCNLYIVGEQLLWIKQALLGIPGANTSDIKTVYSHPQALLQTKEFLDSHGYETVALANTALSAKAVSEFNDITKAAVASVRAAKLYNLQVINECINSDEGNCTRFVVVSNKNVYLNKADNISIRFYLPHESGSLYNILGHFIFNNLNMTSIESRPVKNSPWEYCFYVTFNGNLKDASVINALKGIKEEAKELKILGNY